MIVSNRYLYRVIVRFIRVVRDSCIRNRRVWKYRSLWKAFGSQPSESNDSSTNAPQNPPLWASHVHGIRGVELLSVCSVAPMHRSPRYGIVTGKRAAGKEETRGEKGNVKKRKPACDVGRTIDAVRSEERKQRRNRVSTQHARAS